MKKVKIIITLMMSKNEEEYVSNEHMGYGIVYQDAEEEQEGERFNI